MAALDVVHRRLRQVGLGPLTLELHSNKVNKRTVLEELKRTRDAQHKPARGDLSIIDKLGETSGFLNAFAKRLHEPLRPSGLTPQAILGLLARSQESTAPSCYSLARADQWTSEDLVARRAVIADVSERARALGPVPANVWRGVRRDALDPVERQALGERVRALSTAQSDAERHASVATEVLGAAAPKTVGELKRSMAYLSVTPLPSGLDRSTLTSAPWNDLDGLQRLIEAGRAYVAAWADAEQAFNEAGRTADFGVIRTSIVTKGAGLFRLPRTSPTGSTSRISAASQRSSVASG